MRSNWVIFGGLLRNKDQAKEKLQRLKLWLDEGRIAGVVCCWWRAESDRNPDIVEQVLDSGFKLVQIEEPKLKTVGHTIHQALTWWYALQAVPKHAFVLKVRPDLGNLPESLPETLDGVDLTMNLPEDWPHIFLNRVLVVNAVAISPYYIHDISFYGRREDLLKLANFDLSSEYVCASLAPEQFFFRSPFAAAFPLIDAYLQAYCPLVFDDPETSLKKLDVLLESDFWMEVFAAYLHILSIYFRIGLVADNNRSADGEAFSAYSLAEILNGSVQHSDLSYIHGASATLLTGEQPVKSLLTGRVKADSSARKLASAVAKTSNYSYIQAFEANPLTPAPEVMDLQQKLALVMSHNEHKLERKKDAEQKHYIVMGHHDRVSMSSQDTIVRDLEAELSRMRRIIDDLRLNPVNE